MFIFGTHGLDPSKKNISGVGVFCKRNREKMKGSKDVSYDHLKFPTSTILL
jgi:hypothetical protein